MEPSKSLPREQVTPSATQTNSCCCGDVVTAEPAAQTPLGTDQPTLEPARRTSGGGSR